MEVQIRDDDVLVQSRSWHSAFGRFKQVHEWIVAATEVLHVPSILVNDLMLFPECIEYIKREIDAGRMRPEIHGMDHVDYAKMSETQVEAALQEAASWIHTTLGVKPRLWYTPWGANTPELVRAASNCGLVLVDTSRIIPVKEVCYKLRVGDISVEALDGLEFFTHWWEGGARVQRLCLAIKYGSWAEAQRRHRDSFT